MVQSPLRIAGLVLVAALAFGWAQSVVAQTPAGSQPIPSSAHGDDDLPWSASSAAMMPRSGSMLRANFVGGQGVGFDSSYLTLGLFQPFWIDNQSLWYFDAQGLLIGRTFEEKNGLSGGANVGVGYRAPSPWNCNTVWGTYLFYDYSDAYRNSYSQLGVGGEILGDEWDLRSNFYFPVDKTSNLVSLSPMTGPFYRQYNMFFSQTEVTERAFWGFDAEVGHRLYGHPDAMNIRGYVGTYYYENWDVEGPQFWGISGRIQMHLLPDVWANVVVNHDDMYGTTASGQLTWLFPVCGKRIQCISSLPDCGPCGGGCGPSAPPGRLVQPVRRNPNIVVRDVTRTIETIATDPLTGLPISILHADSNAAPGGDGTFEHPFNTLAATEAEAAGGGYDIILGHADSVFTGEQITLPPDVRFLGEGIDHLVDTEQAGTILLPRATAGTAVPIIDQAPGNAIEVASNNEVSGFTITDPGAAGIFADGVAGPVNINRNSITGGVNGINILNSTGTFDVTETTIAGTSGTAFNVDGGAPIVNSAADITNNSGRIIAVQNTTGGTVTFQGGTLLDDGGAGILVSNNAGAVKIVGATLNNSVANAVDILNSSGAIDLQNVAINSPLGHGVNILNSNAKITGFTINTPALDGIVVTSLNTNRTVALTGNVINGAGLIGIELNANGTGRLDASVTGNAVTSLGNAFDAATAGAGGPLVLAFDNNTLTSTGGAGANITGAGGGPLTITSFLNDVVLDAAAGGILVDAVTFDSNLATPGAQSVLGGASTIGAPGNHVTGDGLRLNNVSGGLSYTNLEIYNDNGTGLFVDGAGVGPTGFSLATTNGKVDTTGGPALSLVDVTLNTTLASVVSTNSTSNGVFLDRTAGTFKSSSTTITQPKNNGIVVQNSPNITADFGTTTVTGAGIDPTDVGSGVVLTNNPGGKFTFGTLNITTDYGAGFVANNSGTVNLLTPGSVTANGGPAVDIQNTFGQTNGVSGWTFNNLTSTNSTTNGLRLIDLPDPFTATGTTTVDNAAATSIEIGGITAATFGTTNITNRQGRGIYVHDTNKNVAFGATTISGTGGGLAGVEMLNSTGGGLTFSQLTVNDGGGQGVLLTNNAGSFTVTGPTVIAQPTGTAIEVNGGTGGVTLNSVTVNNRFGAGIDISGGNQNVSIGPTVINNPNLALGTVLNVDNTTGGKVTVASLTADLNNVAADGVTLVNNAAVVEILGGSVQNASGTALEIVGGGANVTFGASINNHVGRSVDIFGRTGGLVNVTGAVTDIGTGTGIRIGGSTAANTITFANTTTLGTAANRLTGDTAVVIDNNGLPPNTAVVNFANLDIFTNGRQGLVAQNGGTLNVTTGRINTLGAGATGVSLNTLDANVKLAQIDVDGIGAGSDAVFLRNLTGAFTVTGTTTLGATGLIGRGIVADGTDAAITFGTTNIANRQNRGIFMNNTNNNLVFGNTTISGAGGGTAGVTMLNSVGGGATLAQLTVNDSGGQGVLLTNNAGFFTVTGPTVMSQPQGTALEINGGTGGVTLGALTVNNRFGAGIDISGGNQVVTIGTTVINNPNVATGTVLNVDNTTGGKVSIASLTADLNNAVADGVTLVNNAAIVEVLGGMVQNASGTALRINGGGEDVTFGAAINNHVGRSVDIFGRTDGLVNITGAVTDLGTGTGIRIGGSTGPNTITFAGKTTLGSAANRLTGDTALIIDGNGMAPDTAVVNFANLDIFTDGRKGLVSQNGGTLNITTGRINTTGAGATGIQLDGIDSKITLAQIDVDNIGPGNEAIVLRDLTGFFTAAGPTTIGATGTVGRGVHIDGGDASITFGSTTVSNRTLDGVLVENTAGTIQFGSTNISGVGSPVSAGVAVVDTIAGAVNFSSINVGPNSGAGFLAKNNDANIVVSGTTTVTGSSTFGIQVDGGNGNISLASVNVTNSAGTGLGVNNLNGTLAIAGGSINTSNGTAVDIQNSLIDVTLTNVTDTNGQAINLVNDTGAFTVSGAVTQNNGNSGAGSVYVLNGNTNVTLGSVAINNTSGIGIHVDNSAGQFKVNGGTVNNTGGQAIAINDTTIDMTLATVSANTGTEGIFLKNTPGKFTITSGGTIQNSGGDGVRFDNAENISITGLKVSNVGGSGFSVVNGTTNTTLTNVTVTGASFAGIEANQANTLALNNPTINSGVNVYGAVIGLSNNVSLSGGTYNSGALVNVLVVNSTDGSIQNVQMSSSGGDPYTNLLVSDSDNWIIRKNTANNGGTGIWVETFATNASVTIEANKVNNATLNDFYLDANAGTTLALVTGLITTPPDANVNNVSTHLGNEFTDGGSGGTITGQIQINGNAYP